MRPYKLVTLSRYTDIFRQLDASIKDNLPGCAEKIVVVSGGQLANFNKATVDWTVLEGTEPFNFARNANLGLSYAAGYDVLLVNDDIAFTNAVTPLIDIVQTHSAIGIVAPKVSGGVGNILQSVASRFETDIQISDTRLVFVAVYIRKEVLDYIGLLDEATFSDSSGRLTYGGEDSDYCYRVQQAGYLLAVTNKVLVKHGFGRNAYSCSYYRQMTPKQRVDSMNEMRDKLKEKYKLSSL